MTRIGVPPLSHSNDQYYTGQKNVTIRTIFIAHGVPTPLEIATMMQASCETTINISADAIWQAISEFGAAGQYIAGVVTCRVEDSGVGALRTLTSDDGNTVVDL